MGIAHLAVALSAGFYIADDVDGFALDSLIHPQTLSYNADASEAFRPGGAREGERFPTLFAFAHAYASDARAGRASADAAPWHVCVVRDRGGLYARSRPTIYMNPYTT